MKNQTVEEAKKETKARQKALFIKMDMFIPMIMDSIEAFELPLMDFKIKNMSKYYEAIKKLRGSKEKYEKYIKENGHPKFEMGESRKLKAFLKEIIASFHEFYIIVYTFQKSNIRMQQYLESEFLIVTSFYAHILQEIRNVGLFLDGDTRDELTEKHDILSEVRRAEGFKTRFI